MFASEILKISISFQGVTQRKTKFHYCVAPPAGHQEMMLLALKVKNYSATMNYFWIVSKYSWPSYLGTTFLHIPRAGGVWDPAAVAQHHTVRGRPSARLHTEDLPPGSQQKRLLPQILNSYCLTFLSMNVKMNITLTALCEAHVKRCMWRKTFAEYELEWTHISYSAVHSQWRKSTGRCSSHAKWLR